MPCQGPGAAADSHPRAPLPWPRGSGPAGHSAPRSGRTPEAPCPGLESGWGLSGARGHEGTGPGPSLAAGPHPSTARGEEEVSQEASSRQRHRSEKGPGEPGKERSTFMPAPTGASTRQRVSAHSRCPRVTGVDRGLGLLSFYPAGRASRGRSRPRARPAARWVGGRAARPEAARGSWAGSRVGSARLQPAPGRCVFQLKGDLLCSPWEPVSLGRPPAPQGSRTEWGGGRPTEPGVGEAGLDRESPGGSQPLPGPWGPGPQVLTTPPRPTGSILDRQPPAPQSLPPPLHTRPGRNALHSFNKHLFSTGGLGPGPRAPCCEVGRRDTHHSKRYI